MTETPPVRIQTLLGGRFVRITILGPILHTHLLLTAQQTRALSKQLNEHPLYTSNTTEPLQNPRNDRTNSHNDARAQTTRAPKAT